MPVDSSIKAYHSSLSQTDKAICAAFAREIVAVLPEAENKVWHGHPVWFLDGNPVVGYHKLKPARRNRSSMAGGDCVRLLFWSGQSFDEPGLAPEGSFKAAEARFTSAKEIRTTALRRWLRKARKIQWDYKNIVKRKGVLKRLR
jgi:hypothetical protein